MFLKLVEIISRYYYSVSNKISQYLFQETEIIPLNKSPLRYIYYYYILNYYLDNSLEVILNRLFKIYTDYNYPLYYEFSYRDNNMIRSSILRGEIKDVFDYTRFNKESDKLMVIMKCNITIDGTSNNIRNIIRKYDTKTKLYNIIYYNFYNDLLIDYKDINIQLGNNSFNVRSMDKDLSIEDA
jgi:hypothetical protein